MMSALNGHHAVVRLLLDFKGNVSMGAYNRRTALHLAAERGKQECCRLLLDAGANINAADGGGCTPLHVAVLKGQIEVRLPACVLWLLFLEKYEWIVKKASDSKSEGHRFNPVSLIG